MKVFIAILLAAAALHFGQHFLQSEMNAWTRNLVNQINAVGL